MSENILTLSEHFHSVQGEGIYCGVPSYFLRFSRCNLLCGGKNGELVKEGKATWFCDTMKLLGKKKDVSFSEILKSLIENDIVRIIEDNFNKTFLEFDSSVHFVLTGGEPLLPEYTKQFTSFLKYLFNENDIKIKRNSNVTIEVETNGTQLPFDLENLIKETGIVLEEGSNIVFHYNCSPKLSNSGNSYEKRTNIYAVEQIKKYPHIFKFVFSEENDLKEIFLLKDIFSLKDDEIVIMKAMTRQSDFNQAIKDSFKMSTKYNIRMSPRLHIAAFDNAQGV